MLPVMSVDLFYLLRNYKTSCCGVRVGSVGEVRQRAGCDKDQGMCVSWDGGGRGGAVRYRERRVDYGQGVVKT